MNKRNLQKELDSIIAAADRRPKLLLHVCCAPCSSYCLEYLNEYFDITVFFANSNIDDSEEYVKRRDEEIRLISQMCPEVGFAEGRYDPDYFRQLVKGHENDPERGDRCSICFAMRLNEAAEYAAGNGFDYFTTTLSISPLKDEQKLCSIGEKAAERYGTVYLPGDFKKKGGYQRSIELSKKYGLYRQNYCGCSYSKEKETENG
ncbi:MAG: epoxyqueuosine reductase QueH [Lachnospiraceae bacterium]|nr:epoxyqueuosine reductase QueH [Candidatus Darwinimomas equi]